MAYSVDLRVKVLSYVRVSNNRLEASKIFGVSLRTIVKWLKMEREGNICDPKPKRPWKKIDPEMLLAEVKTNPGKTLSYFAQIFKVKPSSMFNAFRQLKITRKKRPHSTERETKQEGKYFWQILPNTK